MSGDCFWPSDDEFGCIEGYLPREMQHNAALNDLATKLITPDMKRRAVRDVMDQRGFSERRACELGDLHRPVFKYDKL